MSGLCGWLAGGLARAPENGAADLQAMHRALPPGGASSEHCQHDGAALSASVDLAPALARDGDGLCAAIDGAPRWFDAELADAARAGGHAAALLQAYRRHGEDCLRHLGGAFSLAVLVPADGRALLAVDRMGQRPMCYASGAHGLVFGSTTLAVVAHRQVDATLSPQALYNYLYFHMVPSPGTVFREVAKLEPAQCLVFKDGTAQLRRYWEPDFTPARGGIDQLSEELRATLRDAVRHCSPDQTTGSFLSGGLDSSTVTGILSELRDSSAPAYSIGFAADGYDEIDYARTAARRFEVDLQEYYITPEDVIEAIPRVAAVYDEPFGNSSVIPTFICARRAYQNGTRTMLAGDGGDEIFGGNERYAKQKLFEVYHALPQALRRTLIEPLSQRPFMRHLMPTRKLQSYVEQARIPMPERTQTYNFFYRAAGAGVLESDFLADIDRDLPGAMLADAYHAAPSDVLLERMLYMDWKFTLADNDLRKVGRACELAGVRVRYPFLDDGLVDFSNRVPAGMKLKGQRLRHFFRHASRGYLPDYIIDKSKHGFGLPFGEWLKTSPALQERTYQNLSDLKQRNIVRASFIDELIREHRTGHAAFYGTFVWVLAMLQEWLDAHREPGRQIPPAAQTTAAADSK